MLLATYAAPCGSIGSSDANERRAGFYSLISSSAVVVKPVWSGDIIGAKLLTAWLRCAIFRGISIQHRMHLCPLTLLRV